ncbi:MULTISPECIES: TlpA family protein disulfide reductase [Oceanimonas]|uniref:Redoxin n=1 Tax=Oceanimonas doudoroffii TaxID=84158 RepID=A0A233RED9_9GAMM|nr:MULTISPECIES: TlpA disulfide reductase family protein [Oceanimonas]NHI01262.1 Thiol-disulfide oxidoreductase ResA [Oceanimonas sp. MB9]OXY81755.1 redoxin [Oceanimonas doudoroffii]
MSKLPLWVLTMVLVLAGCREAATLTLADGEQRRLADYRGDWLVVNYFAEWCAPCLRELPLLNALNDAAGPAVLAVSFDAMPAQALQQLQQRLAIRVPVAAGLEGPWPFELPRVLPTTFVLDPDGKLAERHQGELKAEDIARWQHHYWGSKD